MGKFHTLVILIVCILVYANSLSGEFVMDDWPVVAENPNLTDAGNIPGFFTSGVWNNTGIVDDQDDYLYRPVFLATLYMAFQVFGTQAVGYHALNLVLHAVNALLVYLLLCRLLSAREPAQQSLDSRFRGNDDVSALIGALLFAVHPVHSESVSWIAGMTDPLVTLFILGSFLAFIAHGDSKKIPLLLLSLVLFAMALLSKETAVVLPVIMLGWTLLGNGPGLRDRSWKVGLIASAVLVIVYFVLRKLALGNTIALTNISLDGFFTLILFAGEYIKLLFVPWPMNYYYAVPEGGILQPWGAFIALLIIAAIVLTVIKLEKQRRLVLFSILWSGLTLLPSLSLAFHENPGFSIRFLYLPSIGLVMLLAALLSATGDQHRRKLHAGGLIIMVIFSVITVMSNRIWQDEVTFYTHAQQVTPAHPGPASGLAKYYQRNKQPGKAIDYYIKTAELGNNKIKAIAYEHIGLIYGMQGNIEQSTRYYQLANELAPNRSTILVGLGNNAWSRKDMQAAERFYLQAISANNKNYEAIHNLSLLYRNLGDMQRAMYYQQQAQQLQQSRGHTP